MSAHVQAQVLRFVRMFAFALAGQLAVVGTSHLGWSALASVALGAAEVAVRQVFPVKPLPPRISPVQASPADPPSRGLS